MTTKQTKAFTDLLEMAEEVVIAFNGGTLDRDDIVWLERATREAREQGTSSSIDKCYSCGKEIKDEHVYCWHC